MKSVTLLTLAAYALAAPLPPPAQIPFNVPPTTIQLALYDPKNTYLGCATSIGQWTTDSSQCRTFTSTSTSHTSAGETCGTTLLSAEAGDGTFWNCGDNGATAFWVSNATDAAEGRKISDRPVHVWDFYRDRDDAPHWTPGPWCCVHNP